MELGKCQLGINKQFDRIISRFAVDIHGTSEIRGLGIVLPVIVREPTVFRGYCNQITGAFMGNASRNL